MAEASNSALTMQGIKKRFGNVVALGGVDLEVQAGEVHALIGENGAGKSTLMKVLSGALFPDEGELRVFGRRPTQGGPLEARRLGVAMIYQELNLAPDLTVAQNLLLGQEPRRFGFVDRKEMHERTMGVLALMDHRDLAPERRVSDLGPGARQLVEVARALIGEARIVVMDEPTSSLSRHDTEKLFEVVAALKKRGVAVIYISHFLDEVKRIADRYTVLRDGQTVKTGVIADTTVPEIIEAMVGRKLEEVFPRVPHDRGEVVLRLVEVLPASVSAQVRADAASRVSLELHAGEIFGIAGLVGAGRTELMRAIYGLDGLRSGEITVLGDPDRGKSPAIRVKQGVGMLSENRKEEGLALDLTIADNATLSHLAPLHVLGIIRRRQKESATRTLIDRLGIRSSGPRQTVGELSGGNQQKVALARLLHQDARIVLLDEPTRGIDVASKVEVYRLIGELAQAGKAVLMVSSYVPELLGICDRIAVMHRGSLGEARPTGTFTEQSIMDEAARGISA